MSSAHKIARASSTRPSIRIPPSRIAQPNAPDLRRELVAKRPVAGDDRNARGAAAAPLAPEQGHRFHQIAMALARLERADRADGEVGVAEVQRGARLRAFVRRRRTKARAVDAARNHRDALARDSGARERVGDRG